MRPNPSALRPASRRPGAQPATTGPRPTAFLPALLLALAAASSPGPAGARGLNDTGQVICRDADTNEPIACAGTGQDGESGRDVEHPDNADGAKGFRFRKIGPAGEPLPRDASAWSCVRDLTTGLMWEVKTDDGGLRDYRKSYTVWGDGRQGDVSVFVRKVNAQGLCGRQDWRLPTRLELHSLADFSLGFPGPAIDSAWFPNTLNTSYITGTPSLQQAGAVRSVSFSDGATTTIGVAGLGQARLVRTGP